MSWEVEKKKGKRESNVDGFDMNRSSMRMMRPEGTKRIGVDVFSRAYVSFQHPFGHIGREVADQRYAG